MRRYLVVLAAAALVGGCKEMFSAHAGRAAKAGSLELSSEQLAGLLTSAKTVSLNRETADFITNVWVDYALVAEAAATGRSLTDSATIAAAMWPQLAEMTAAHWFDSLVAERSQISSTAVDAAYNGTAMRLFQHILFAFGQNATGDQKAAARKAAQDALAKVRAGADFGTLAMQLSTDPGSARDSGYLPPSPRGRWVAAFDSAGWILDPGQMTGVVETPYGFHIIRRPSLAQARPRVEAWVRDAQVQAVSSVYMDSLAITSGLKLKSGAVATIREAVADPDRYYRSPKAIADFKGGELDTRELLRWVRNFPPQVIGQIKQQPDSSLEKFGTMLATNILLLRQADSAGVKPTAEEWDEVKAQYLASLDSLRTDMRLDSTLVADSAGARVSAYFESILANRLRLRPIPASLGLLLRDELGYQVNEAGVTAALDLARQKQAEAGATPPQPGTMVPAPGGPPMPAPTAPQGAAPGGQ